MTAFVADLETERQVRSLPTVGELTSLIIGHEVARPLPSEGMAVDIRAGDTRCANCPVCGERSMVIEGKREHPARSLRCESCGADPADLLAALRSTDTTPATAGGDDWPAGIPMDPLAVPAEPLPPLAGFPFLHAKSAALIVGPTGGGRSSLVQACAYDAAHAGLKVAYLGSEVGLDEFNRRAADLIERRQDVADEARRELLANVRYFRLMDMMVRAWRSPGQWAEQMDGYDVVLIDPLSRAGAALDLNFDQSSNDYVTWHSKIVQPVVDQGSAVVLLDNIGHSETATKRAKGASGKGDSCDLTFFCKRLASPARLVVIADKVRSVASPIQHNDEWIFDREGQRVVANENRAGLDMVPTGAAEMMSRIIEDQDGIGTVDLRAAMKGIGKDHAGKAKGFLLDKDYIRVREGTKTLHHHSVKPYRQGVEQAGVS